MSVDNTDDLNEDVKQKIFDEYLSSFKMSPEQIPEDLRQLVIRTSNEDELRVHTVFTAAVSKSAVEKKMNEIKQTDWAGLASWVTGVNIKAHRNADGIPDLSLPKTCQYIDQQYDNMKDAVIKSEVDKAMARWDWSLETEQYRRDLKKPATELILKQKPLMIKFFEEMFENIKEELKEGCATFDTHIEAFSGYK